MHAIINTNGPRPVDTYMSLLHMNKLISDCLGL